MTNRYALETEFERYSELLEYVAGEFECRFGAKGVKKCMKAWENKEQFPNNVVSYLTDTIAEWFEDNEEEEQYQDEILEDIELFIEDIIGL